MRLKIRAWTVEVRGEPMILVTRAGTPRRKVVLVAREASGARLADLGRDCARDPGAKGLRRSAGST